MGGSVSSGRHCGTGSSVGVVKCSTNAVNCERCLDSEGMEGLEHHVEIRRAMFDGDWDECRLILRTCLEEKKKDDVDKDDDENKDRSSSSSRRRPLLEEYAREYDKTLLHTACGCGAPSDVVERAYAADPSQIARRDRYGQAPLFYALGRQQRRRFSGDDDDDRVVLALLDRAPETVFGSDRAPRTALHAAVAAGRSPTVVRRLLEIHPAAVRAADAKGRTPIRLCLDHRDDRRRTTTPTDDRRLRVLDLLLEADAEGTVAPPPRDNDTKSTTTTTTTNQRRATRSPLREAFRFNRRPDRTRCHRAWVDTTTLISLVHTTKRSESVATDEHGNFPLHLACEALPVHDV